MPTVQSLDAKQLSLPRAIVREGNGIQGRDKNEKVSAREAAAFSGTVERRENVVTFVDGKAEVSDEVAEALVEHYPKSVFVVPEAPAKG